MYTKPLMIGLMLSKDDKDVLPEIMAEYCKQFDIIYCIDASDDGSIDIIKSFDKVEYAATEKELGIDGTLLKDGIRQLLLSKIQDKYGSDGWIFPIQSDEMFHGELSHLMELVAKEPCNIINCLVAHFIMTESDVLVENLPTIMERKLWYFLGQCESCGFKNQQGIYYNFFEHMRVLPHGIYPQVSCSRVPVRKHYNMRSVTQLKQRIEDRLKRNWQPAYKAIKDNGYFITDPKQMITAGAIYSPIQKFNGNWNFFKEYEYWTKVLIT